MKSGAVVKGFEFLYGWASRKSVVPSGFETIAGRAARSRKRYLKEIRNERPRTETFFVSFPKSGRTWHRAMVGTYLAMKLGADLKTIFELDELIEAHGIGRVRYSHNGSNVVDGLPPNDPVVATPELWREKRVLLMVRDVKDILVSAWHHARFRTGHTTAELADFVRYPMTGAEKVLTAYGSWHRGLKQASASMVVSYEEMHNNPQDVLARSLAFFGIADVDARCVESAVGYCRFEAMRDRELSGFHDIAKASTASSDERARKVRVGKIGSHVEHLSAQDVAWIDDLVARLGNPYEAICAREPS